MRFLVDAQLPPALARWIARQGHDAQHVAGLGLEAASDGLIWEQALASAAVIVTKDQDFARRRAAAADGPHVVWMRVGNTRRSALLRWFPSAFPEILLALERGEPIVEVRRP